MKMSGFARQPKHYGGFRGWDVMRLTRKFSNEYCTAGSLSPLLYIPLVKPHSPFSFKFLGEIVIEAFSTHINNKFVRSCFLTITKL